MWMHGDNIHQTNFEADGRYLMLPGATTGLVDGSGTGRRRPS